MFKKIILLGVALIMVFSLAACNNSALEKQIEDLRKRIEKQDNRIDELDGENKILKDEITALELASCKVGAIVDIEIYVSSLDQEDYTEKNWATIQDLLMEGKMAIGTIVDKNEIYTELRKIKWNMETVPIKNAGTFYTLQEAYDQGFLTVLDLKDIAFYHTGEVLDENSETIEYTPRPKMPETLNVKKERQIKRTRSDELRARDNEAITDDVYIRYYYGTYDDCVALTINDEFTGGASVVNEMVIAGIKFRFSSGVAHIEIWKK